MLNKFVGHENEIKRNDIISVQINLLNKCPSKCKSCRKYMWPENEWNVDELINIINILKKNFGLQTIFFCGGDPVIYKDFSKLILFLAENDIKYSLITTLITKDQELLTLIAKTAYRIHISVDAVDKEKYKEIRGVYGFDIMANNLNFINNIKGDNTLPIIRFSSTIGALNYDQTINIYNFAKENNCLLRYNYLRIWNEIAMTSENEQVFYNDLRFIVKLEQENKKIISNARNFLIKDFSVNSFDKCYLSHVSAVIDSNGDLYPCCWIMEEFNFYDKQSERAYGNIKNKTTKEIIEQFNNRLNVCYPQNNGLCKTCTEYYGEVISDLEKIFENKKEVLFF